MRAEDLFGRLDWGRVVERLCFLFPPVIGVGIVGVLQEAGPGVPLLESGLVLVGSFGYALLTIGLTVALVLDGRRIRRTKQWRPRPWLNGLLAVVFGPIAGAVYLYRRHKRFGTPPGWASWWLVVALSLLATIFGTVATVVGLVLSVPTLVATGVGVAGAIAFGAFPVAIHQDAAYVSRHADSWRPNPGLYLGLAFLSLSVPPFQPIVATYYLGRRHRAVA